MKKFLLLNKNFKNFLEFSQKFQKICYKIERNNYKEKYIMSIYKKTFSNYLKIILNKIYTFIRISHSKIHFSFLFFFFTLLSH
jgi:hypothetical protein